MLVIDCGVLFPEDDHPGVDLLLPGLDYLDEEKLAKVKALVLTHGHEDHIGAVPYLLKRRPDIPIYGSKLTLALVEAKLREHRIKGYKLNVVHEGDVAEVGEQFDLEFIAVNHSIPDALAVCVRTDAGTLINTGDFKMDQLPLDGRITDLRAFARLGEEGVDLFMVDSTNAEVPGFVKSETEIEPAIERVFEKAKKEAYCGLLRLPCASRPASAQYGRASSPQGLLRRSFNGPQYGCCSGPGLPRRAGEHRHRAARPRPLPR
ncbi:ribonuclease J2 [Cutibacterium acnes JCM 18916]|nr:ribonuclease J2 [Cutibacterium acnes JCM 18916]GAE75265.1 ribonuclease J2 [Cutibacterium acnes JCM 18918]